MQQRQFEFDPAKSESNFIKHGIGFADAQRLWGDPDLLVLPSGFPSEQRQLGIGLLEGMYWTAVFTERSGTVRLISIRRSRARKREIYEKTKIRHDS